MNSRWPAPMLSHSLLFGQRVLASQLQDLWFARKCTEGKIGRMWIVRIDDVYFARWPIFSRSSFPNAHMRPPKSRSGQSSSSSSSIVYASPFAKSMWRIYICKIYPIGVTVGVVYYIAKWIPLVFDRIQRHRKLAIGTKTAEILLSCFVSSVPLRYICIYRTLCREIEFRNITTTQHTYSMVFLNNIIAWHLWSTHSTTNLSRVQISTVICIYRRHIRWTLNHSPCFWSH